MFTVIVAVYQDLNTFRLYWESFRCSIKYDTSLIIINDKSPYDTTNFISHISSKKHNKLNIKLINNEYKCGYAESINKGLKFVSGKYIIFSDSDTILPLNWQSLVISSLSDNSIGGVGGVLVYPQTNGIQCCGLTYTKTVGRHLWLNGLKNNISEKAYSVQSTVFAFFATKIDIIQNVGLLDTDFYNGYEDIDYQFRIRKKGQKIIINPKLIIYHWEKSNGIFRSFNRRSNLGLLWKKYGEYIETDLWYFLFRNLDLIIDKKAQYIGIDLSSSRTDACAFWDEFKIRYPTNLFLKTNHYYLVEEGKTIWLNVILPYDYVRTEKPFLLLCDNFIQLLDNQYWWSLRNKINENDLIIDLYGNCMFFKEIIYSFWPGNKIR